MARTNTVTQAQLDKLLAPYSGPDAGWLSGIDCACGEDDFRSVPAPEGTHTLTYCTTH